jgi:hypothetical protein
MAKRGRPKGSRNKATIRAAFDKELLREELRLRVREELLPMLDAQIANAKGIKYLVVREGKTGKFLRVTESMAKAKLGKGEEIVEVWEKDPSTPAWTDLMNRAIDKPAEHVDLTATHTGGLEITWRSSE